MAEEGADVPKKFIRTYATDLAVAQNQTSSSVNQQTPVAPMEPQVPVGAATPPAPPSFVPPASVTAPAPQSVPVFPSSAASPLHTYEGDFSARTQATEASTISILAAQQDAAPSITTTVPQAEVSKHNLLFILGGFVLVGLGLGGVGYAVVVYQTNTAPVETPFVAPAPIFVDEREELVGTGGELKQNIVRSVEQPLPVDGVRLLYTAASVSGTQSVFSALLLPAPGPLLRNVSPSGGMAGVIRVRGAQSPFFMLSVLSYGETFAGMLSWEPTLLQDLSAFFPLHPEPVVPQLVSTTTATTTAPKTSTNKTATTTATSTPIVPLYKAGFFDEIIANTDVRVYRDAQNRPVLVYGYWNQSTLLVAREPAAYAELIQRLSTSRAQ